MEPATAWDANSDDERAWGWSVTGVLRARQSEYISQAISARRRVQLHEGKIEPPKIYVDGKRVHLEHFSGIIGPIDTISSDRIAARWRGGPTVLALLFAHPDSDALRILDNRRKYFDIRTGDTWDLFCPGYYHCPTGGQVARKERAAGNRPIGRNALGDWYFSPDGFNSLREHVEQSSERRWQYSGGTDLVLVNGWLPEEGDPIIDWASTISVPITDQASGVMTVSIAEAIERISRDLETGAEDSSYGLSEITDGPPPANSHSVREFMINALGGIAASLGLRVLGL